MPSSGAVQKDRKEVAFIKETNSFGGQVGAVRHQTTYRFANFVAYKIYVRIPGQLRVKYSRQLVWADRLLSPPKQNRSSSIKQHLSARTNCRELYSDNVFSIIVTW